MTPRSGTFDASASASDAASVFPRPPSPSVSAPCCVCMAAAETAGEDAAQGSGNDLAAEAKALGFELVQHFSLKAICIQEWRCIHTELRVLVCRIASPLCNLYATLPTEAHTDEGLPHTLEHLVFLGSRRYPYKGVLDFLANRCLSQGTNAWTATDHTTYTLTTAGSEGLLNLLPVYLDHLMLPTLQENAFKTEVHHLTREAGSAGVVYSEMEARERQASSVLYRKLVELLYPGESGYRYETGGLMEQIRRTSNERVREFHKNFYKWSNLSLIFTGIFDGALLLRTVRDAVEKIEEARLQPPARRSAASATTAALDAAIAAAVGAPEHAERLLGFSGSRPWTDARNFAAPAARAGGDAACGSAAGDSASSSAAFHRVAFPADDAESGRVALAWRGPAWGDVEAREAVDILGSYLSEGNVAPLQRALVQCDDPVCASVDFSSENFKVTSFFLEAADVRLLDAKPAAAAQAAKNGASPGGADGATLGGQSACKKQKREEGRDEEDAAREEVTAGGAESSQLEAVGKRMRELIAKEADGPLDLARIRTLLRRELLQFYRALETSPHDTMAELLNEYIVNHTNPDDLQKFLDLASVVDSLSQKPESFWRAELRRWFLGDARSAATSSVGVTCYPSTSLSGQLHREDKAREAALRERIGDANLEELTKAIEAIKESQKQPPPQEVLLSVPVASIDRVFLPPKAPLTNFDAPDEPANAPAADAEKQPQQQRGAEAAIADLPFLLQLDAQATDFVQIKLLSRLPESLTAHERQALLLLADLIFECDVLFPASLAALLDLAPAAPAPAAGDGVAADACPDGYVRVSYEKLTQLLFAHTTSNAAGFGFYADSGAGAGSASLLCDLFTLSVTAPADRYYQALALVFGVLCGLQIESRRVAVHVKRHLKQLVRKKRSAKFLVQQLENGLRYSRASVPNACGWGQQLAAMKRMQRDLRAATETLVRVYRRLFQQAGFCVHVVADLAQLPANWQQPWSALEGLLAADRPKLLQLPLSSQAGGAGDAAGCAKDAQQPRSEARMGRSKRFAPVAEVLNVQPSAAANIFAGGPCAAEEEADAREGKTWRLACGIGSSDSGHVLVSVKAPVGYENEQLAAISVMAECCSMMEGLLFRTVRGAGFAYGCDLSYSPWQGQLTLRLSPATNPAAAARAVVDAFESRVKASKESGARIFSDEEIVAGKCGTLFSIVSREETQSCQAAQSLVWPLRGRSRDENRRMLAAVAATTAEEVEAAAQMYLHAIVLALTGSEEERESVGGTVCIVTNKKKVEGTVKELEAAKIKVEAVPTEGTLRSLQLAPGEKLSDLGEEEEEAAESGEDGEDDDENDDDDDDEEDEDDDDEDADEEDQCCGGHERGSHCAH